MDGKKKETVIKFNPSARKQIILDTKEIDYIASTIKEAGIKFANKADKDLMIVLMGLIRKKLREDPTFGPKLRDILELDRYFEDMRTKPSKLKKVHIAYRVVR